MNLRQHKKAAKKAMAKLIADHGYRPSEFSAVRRGEEITLDAPWAMDARLVTGRDTATCNAGFFSPKRGTPIFWSHDYWTQDADPSCPIHILSEVEFWSAFDPAELDQERTPDGS